MNVWLQQIQDMGSSMTGCIHKAVLCVPRVDFRGAGTGLNTGTREELENLEQEAGDAAAAAAAALREGMFGRADSTSSFSRIGEMAGSGYCAMQVQFNPESIRIVSMADTVHRGGIGDQGTNDNTQIIASCNAVMTVKLIFDAVNVKDAFQWEKYRLSAGDFVLDAAAAARRNSFRVDDKVNALLALTVHGAVRHVVFHWSNMTFSGELSNVSANYSMFSPSGRPVRADVTLTITQREEAGEKKINYWEEAYRKLFVEENGNFVKKMAAGADTVKNLVNLNL